MSQIVLAMLSIKANCSSSNLSTMLFCLGSLENNVHCIFFCCTPCSLYFYVGTGEVALNNASSKAQEFSTEAFPYSALQRISTAQYLAALDPKISFMAHCNSFVVHQDSVLECITESSFRLNFSGTEFHRNRVKKHFLHLILRKSLSRPVSQHKIHLNTRLSMW